MVWISRIKEEAIGNILLAKPAGSFQEGVPSKESEQEALPEIVERVKSTGHPVRSLQSTTGQANQSRPQASHSHPADVFLVVIKVPVSKEL